MKVRLFAGLGLLFAAATHSSTSSPVVRVPAAGAQVVTVVRVKDVQHVPVALWPRLFRKSRPDYEKVPGLQFKYFIDSAEEPRYFGGVYLWASRASAEAWFSPQWFERVRQLRHAEGEVRYFDLMAVHQFVPATHNWVADSSCQAVLVSGAVAAKPAGALRRYDLRAQGKPAVILLFENPTYSRSFVATLSAATAEVFDAPVLLRTANPD